jgi:hypothetical protein
MIITIVPSALPVADAGQNFRWGDNVGDKSIY